MFNLCFPLDRLSLKDVKNGPRMRGMGLYVILDSEFVLWIGTCTTCNLKLTCGI